MDKKNSFIKSEIDYLLIWLYRRIKKFDEAIKIGNEYSNLENEPRFLHGLALAHESKAYNNFYKGNNYIELKELKISKKYFLLSLEEYQRILQDTFYPLSNLILKQQIGILNSIIDTNIRLLEKSKHIDKAFLEEGRYFMEILKSKVDLLNPSIDYNELGTINHTECELEFYEARILFKEKKYSDALKKLSYASKRSRLFVKKKEIVGDKFQTIISDINKLRIKIYNVTKAI